MEETNYNNGQCSKKGCFKYFVMFFATLLGAFLAFYVVADMTIKTLFSPEYQMRRMEKAFDKMDKNIMRDMQKDIAVVGKMIPQNPVELKNVNSEYIVEISLKPFGNTSKNINVKVENGNILKIDGSREVKKGDKENMMSMSQSYVLEDNIDVNKITKKEDNGKYIITLPKVSQENNQ